MLMLIVLQQDAGWISQFGLPILTLLLGGGLATALVTALFNYKGKKLEIDADAENKMREELWQEVHKLRAMITEVSTSETAWQEKYWKLREEVAQLPAKIQELGSMKTEADELRRKLEDCQRRITGVETNKYFEQYTSKE